MAFSVSGSSSVFLTCEAIPSAFSRDFRGVIGVTLSIAIERQRWRAKLGAMQSFMYSVDVSLVTHFCNSIRYAAHSCGYRDVGHA